MSNDHAFNSGKKDPQSGDKRTAHVASVRESLVSIDTGGKAIMKNEVGHICVGEERLMAEVLRIQGDNADMQVFEDTRGVRVGDPVEMSGNLLSVFFRPRPAGAGFRRSSESAGFASQRPWFFPATRRRCFPIGSQEEMGFYAIGFNGR